MKNIMMIIALLASCLAFAEQLTIAPDPLERRLKKEEFQKLPPEQRRAYLDRLSYINNGGHVIKANTGKGTLKVIVSSDKFDISILERPLSAVEKFMKIKVEIVRGASATVENAKDRMAIDKANVAVYVVENSKLPRLLNAPEEGWAIVNVLSLNEGDPKKEVLEKRIVKEVMRGVSLATGCANVGGCMQPVSDIRSLDFLIAETYPLNARAQIYKSLEEFGVEPRTEASYKVACQQGWAPAPTNEIQQAIWDKVHAIPDKPITIEYDPKIDK